MDEMEYYYVLEGEGIVQDDDDIKIIKHGDLSATDHGHRHSIENKNEKIKIVNEFFEKIAKNRNYHKLKKSINGNIIKY